MSHAGEMARCIIFPMLLVLVAAQDTSSPSCTQAGHSLLQTKRSTVSAAPAASVANKGAMGPEGKQHVSAMGAKLNGLSRLALRPRLFKDGFCRSHPCSILAVQDTVRGLGATAAMDEQGYQAVAKLKDDEEMKTFILRVVEDYDCHVKDDFGLMGIVPWFSGTTAVQTLGKLEKSLLFAVLANGERWISYKNSAGTTGADVPLDLHGYMEVAIMWKNLEMETFARRIADEMGIKVTDEGGFKGMIKYHSGAAAFQSFDKLRDEIKSAAASPGAWAELKSI